MDIQRIMITPPNEARPPKSSAGNSVSNPQPIAKTTCASTPSINIQKTTAITEGPVPDLDTVAHGALPYEGFDELYDNSRLNSPEVNGGPDKGLPDLPPFEENSGHSELPNVDSSPRITSPANSQLIDITTAAPTSGVGVHGTTATTLSDAPCPNLLLVERRSLLASRAINTKTFAPSSGIDIHETTSTDSCDKLRRFAPSPGTTSPITSRLPNTAARSSNRIPDDAEIFDVDTWAALPNAAARSSNRIPDDAEIFDVDAWVACPKKQGTQPSSDPSSQASTRTLLESEQSVVIFLASNSHRRDIPQGPSGSRTGSNAKFKDGYSFPWPQLETRFDIDIETAFRNKTDDQLGAALLCTFCNDCHKRHEIREGKQKKDEPPLSPLFPAIDNYSSIEGESSDEDEANVKYNYNVRPYKQTFYGNELKAIEAHPGNAIWALVESRLDPVSDPRKWETACNRCSQSRNEPLCHFDEQREQTIPLEEAAVDDKKNQTEGAAPYNPNLYTTTSSIRELRVKPHNSQAEVEDSPHTWDMAMSSNPSPPPPSEQATSSDSDEGGKQEANGDGNSNESQPTPPLTSRQATSSRSRNRGTREANGNFHNNASGTQAFPPAPSPSPKPTRSSRRNRPLLAPQPQVAPLTPAPAVSSSRRSQRHAPCPPGQNFDCINAMTREQVQTPNNNKTKEANNEDDEQGRRNGEKIKKSVSWDWKENGKANSKRKASEAVDVDGGCGPARARRKIVSDSSNGSNESGASQKSQKSAASGADLSASTAGSSPLASRSGTGTLAPGNGERKVCDSSPSSNASGASKKSGKSAASETSAVGSGTGSSGTGSRTSTLSSGTNLTVPGAVAARTPDPATHSTPTATPPRSEGSTDRPGRLRLHVAAEANPEHPDHEAYLVRSQVSRKKGKQRGKE